ncbi:MAG TPA: hypothetical protein VKT53_04180 [Candidatus Acidoferrum sp.]|nr:hypothetical protein [Candidatus Acidoferrum sp.]
MTLLIVPEGRAEAAEARKVTVGARDVAGDLGFVPSMVGGYFFISTIIGLSERQRRRLRPMQKLASWFLLPVCLLRDD